MSKTTIFALLLFCAVPSLARDVPMTPDLAHELENVITGAGFVCPEAKQAFFRGREARGNVMKIHCGDRSSRGSDPALIYRIILRPDNRGIVETWD